MRRLVLGLILCLTASAAMAQGVYVPQMEAGSVYSGPSLNGTPVADILGKQLANCWQIPKDVKNPENYPATMTLSIEQNGHIAKIKLSRTTGQRYIEDKIFVKMADSAMQAVRNCDPLKNMPVEAYEAWRQVEVTFDAKKGIHFK